MSILASKAWPSDMTERDREVAEERAAIIADGCNISQHEAEKRTLGLWLQRKERQRAQSQASVSRAADRSKGP